MENSKVLVNINLSEADLDRYARMKQRNRGKSFMDRLLDARTERLCDFDETVAKRCLEKEEKESKDRESKLAEEDFKLAKKFELEEKDSELASFIAAKEKKKHKEWQEEQRRLQELDREMSFRLLHQEESKLKDNEKQLEADRKIARKLQKMETVAEHFSKHRKAVLRKWKNPTMACQETASGLCITMVLPELGGLLVETDKKSGWLVLRAVPEDSRLLSYLPRDLSKKAQISQNGICLTLEGMADLWYGREPNARVTDLHCSVDDIASKYDKKSGELLISVEGAKLDRTESTVQKLAGAWKKRWNALFKSVKKRPSPGGRKRTRCVNASPGEPSDFSTSSEDDEEYPTALEV